MYKWRLTNYSITEDVNTKFLKLHKAIKDMIASYSKSQVAVFKNTPTFLIRNKPFSLEYYINVL